MQLQVDDYKLLTGLYANSPGSKLVPSIKRQVQFSRYFNAALLFGLPIYESSRDRTARQSRSGLSPGFTGLYQVNAMLPTGIASNWQAPLILSQGARTSATISIPIE